MSNVRFIDLFAGIGGMRLGMESIGANCVFTCEKDRFALQTYNANFGDHVEATDIRSILAEDIPDHDVLTAGFPCQPFSLAGVSKNNSLGRQHGFLDATRGTLFFDVARIIKEKRPCAFLLENVRNLVSHDGGNTIGTIERVIRELGYSFSYAVIDARCFVPQGRARVFIVGFRDNAVEFDFQNVELPPQPEWPTLKTILHAEDCSGITEERYTRLFGIPDDRYTLSDHLWSYLQAYAAKHRAKGNGFGYGLFGPDDVARTLSARYHKDGAEILIHPSKVGANPRRLTPREAARLMGFVGTPEHPWIIPVSDTQAYRQFGNAVVPQVVGAIAHAMSPYIEASVELPNAA